MEVHLWHGKLDRNATVVMGRYVAATIPNCRAKFYEDEGHVSLLANYTEEILGALSAGSEDGPRQRPEPNG